jgi:hypothetical protein
VGGEVHVQQGLDAHPFPLGQQQRDVIDAVGGDVEDLGHGVPPRRPKPYHHV